MENRDKVYEAVLLKKLSQVNLSADNDSNRPIVEELTKYGGDALHLAHGGQKVIWFYNLLSHKLEYSEIAHSHNDRASFSDEPYSGKEWIRGRVFEYRGKCYILVYLGSSTDFSWTAAPVDRNLLSKSLGDLYRQIQDNFKYKIFDITDEDTRTLAENKKKK